MAMYLNNWNTTFNDSIRSKIFVDKSMLIKYANENISTNDKFMCVTRPRRFGKTMALSMLNAYYSKGCDSRDLFNNLRIYNDPSFESHLNKHNVFYIDMASLYCDTKDKSKVIDELTKIIIDDLNEVFPNVLTNQKTIAKAIVKIYSTLKERFIFLIDEWDCIYRESKSNDLKNEYTELLRALFKGNECSFCIDLVYMTGILPISRYKGDSTLNNFNEYNMIECNPLEEFMGFTEEEVKALCDKHNMSFDELTKWYNGYNFYNFGPIYNPRSVVQAITKKRCLDYWASTKSMEEIVFYINYKNGVLKTRLGSLLAHEKIDVDIKEFSIESIEINSINEALTMLIHLGYLAYDSVEKKCYIPNYEIEQELNSIVKKLNWDDITTPMDNSHKVVKALLDGNIDYVVNALRDAHVKLCTEDTKTNEGVIGLIFDIVFYNIRRKYYVYKELPSSTGTADIVFIPKNVSEGPAIIIELKHNKTANAAIAQILNREYINCLSNYHGEVRLIGINYTPKALRYTVKIDQTITI